MFINNNIQKITGIETTQETAANNSHILQKNEPDSITITTKKKINKKKLVTGLALIGGAALIGVAIYKKKKSLNTIPKELRELYKSIKHKNGQEFIDDAYSGLVKYMDLDGIAPSRVNLTNKPDGLFNSITGGFMIQSNSIEYSQGFKTKLTKPQQFNLLSHELFHCKQFNQIIRTEGLGIEALTDAYTNTMLQKNILGQNMKETLVKKYGESEAIRILKEKKDSLMQEYMPKLKECYNKTLQLSKFAADSPEGIQAKKYADALSHYEGLGLLGTAGELYKANLLEQEAYKYGETMQKAFETMQNPISALLDMARVIISS